jgi:hypothetical protein
MMLVAAVLASGVGMPATGTAQLPSRRVPSLPAWTAAVDAALGRHGALNPGNVYKFSFPRSDMHVAVDGVTLAPALALGSWVAFKPASGNRAMVMGDLVLGEAEVDPVMRALQAGGVEQTALHNHVLRESPHVMYMHIFALGDAAKIAQTLHAALALSGTPLGTPASAAATPAMELDTAAIARALGHAGKVNGGVYQVSVPRPETIRDAGEVIPPAMGTATGINFQPTGHGQAALTGDFVLLGREVNPVIRALRAHGIAITALHSHMLTEEPRLFFMHFWANDDAVTLARGVHAALDVTNLRQR